MASSPTKYIRELERRLDYLEDRIASGNGSEDSIGMSKGEFFALRWALPILYKEAVRWCSECGEFKWPSEFRHSRHRCIDCCGPREADNRVIHRPLGPCTRGECALTQEQPDAEVSA